MDTIFFRFSFINLVVSFIVAVIIFSLIATAQNPEINDQFDTTHVPEKPNTQPHIVEENEIVVQNKIEKRNSTHNVTEHPSFIAKIYRILILPIQMFLSQFKVRYVLRNIGTCAVNGAMELISYYFPAPMIPLIASAAGMVIPFEPVVMLRDRMPVTSYRRAFMSAVNSFLGTFDRYKVDDGKFDDDPYMTRRFNRRFMGDGNKSKDVKID